MARLSYIFIVQHFIYDGVVELLQDGHKHPIIQRHVAVRVDVDQPSRQCSLSPCQFALDGVLGQDGQGLAAEGAAPLESLVLELK